MGESGDNSGRDGQGRFAAGNAGGPGGPRRRASEFRRAMEEAITPEYVGFMIKKATKMALEGNLPAMRLVFERLCGRAAEAPVEAEPLGIRLPQLRTAADCNIALDRVGDAVCAGRLGHESAELLIGMIQARLKAMEVGELETRLVELEKTLESVDPNRKRGR
jgi:hypothetical protein